MKGHLRNNLYTLVGSTVTGGAATSTCSDKNKDDTTLWHMRLGHMSEYGLQELHKRNLLGGITTSREKRNVKPPVRYRFEDLVAFVLITSGGDPSNFQEAVQSFELDSWLGAMVEEMESLYKNNTWNAMVFQIYAMLSRAFDSSVAAEEPPSYKGVALGGIGTGALQSLLLTPVELVKVHLQRGLTIIVIRDSPAHGFYFWTYEYMREQMHPGCRKSGEETLRTMLIVGGLAGVASWVSCYPVDVIKTRLQAQSRSSPPKYSSIFDCLRKSVREEGYGVPWRGLRTTVSRAFVVNGAVFVAYEITLKFLVEWPEVCCASQSEVVPQGSVRALRRSWWFVERRESERGCVLGLTDCCCRGSVVDDSGWFVEAVAHGCW
ncbi:LOW QUALITY PROTEIN: mitochondrial citrate transporter B-like [Malania oleifera]|uniref:LOW QUALITY PROTEIN: mitochondrial citrate transporter B-like n=1 Tax=Malania oleifera TaxID=397392 RepID=UPI0025AE6DA0|nr:LOW QUALITY PROTEIN: mitochondrial citrate transporter B-like [Malania oleifera]